MNASKSRWRRGVFFLPLLVTVLACGRTRPAVRDWSQYRANPFVVPLDMPPLTNSAGGLLAADVDDDGLMDYLVSAPGRLAAVAHDGRKLWEKEVAVRVSGTAEEEGLPGHHAPGVQAADIDGDGECEVLFLGQDGVLRVLHGRTGRGKWEAKPPHPGGAAQWEHAVVANFRGEGDRDLLLQATDTQRYRTGRYVAAYRLEDLRRKKFTPLWSREDFLSCAHNGARLADLNGDGRDEVLGQTILGPDGEVLHAVRLAGKSHADNVTAADILPDEPGLEVVLQEEELRDGRRIGSVYLVNGARLVWRAHHERQEPQNAAVGEFDLSSPGLEVWCRSRHNKAQTPFVFSAAGELLSAYAFNEVAPEGWTERGLEVIWTIDWTGGPRQLAAAKERHQAGDVAIFDPMTGAFVLRLEEAADRLYVADVSGDWREELIVLSGGALRIYHNEAVNPHPKQERLWAQAHYRRAKMTWNYYSP